jgi:hypothetical protein
MKLNKTLNIRLCLEALEDMHNAQIKYFGYNHGMRGIVSAAKDELTSIERGDVNGKT